MTPKSDRQKEESNDLVFSYMTLRNLIGFSGMLLPIVLYFLTLRQGADRRIEPSISDYYYTSNGDVLVVTLSVLGVFLITYNGYNWKEKIWTIQAAICGLGVAFSPTRTKGAREAFSVHTALDQVPTIIGIERHLFFAAWFFICLSIISLRFFPKTDSMSESKATGKKTQKEKRNVVYRLCGILMLASVAVLALYFIVPWFNHSLGDFPFVFVMETVAIEAFGISWITKGETFWPDGEHYVTTAVKQVKSLIEKPTLEN